MKHEIQLLKNQQNHGEMKGCREEETDQTVTDSCKSPMKKTLTSCVSDKLEIML